MIKKLLKSRILYIIIIILIVLMVRHKINLENSYFIPYNKSKTVTKNDTADEIFSKTGISYSAAKEMIDSGDFDTVKKINSLYLSNIDVIRNYVFFPFTVEEKMSKSVPMAPVKKGDILVTFSTHTVDWRHGHMALVTNSDEGIVLEHLSVGHRSTFSSIKNWSKYRNFAILRYPDEEKAKEAADYAQKNLINIPYSMFAGIIKKDKSNEENINLSHCSHIVWQAYKAVGVELDSNKGPLVIPKDIAMSEKLKVVQIFGLDPKYYKDRILE